VKGLLADINALGPIEYLIQRMQAEPWADFWNGLGLVFKHFEDVGLSTSSSDLIIWQTCQAEELVLITDNRNLDSSDSLEATIRQYNTPNALPVFTIGDLDKFRTSRAYADRVLEMLYEYLLRIDSVRGTGRLYLP
jgi:predicted nuclease of predicted toxin-antitoxin system